MRTDAGKLYPKGVRSTVSHVCISSAEFVREDEYIRELKGHVTQLFKELREPLYRYLLCLSIRPPQAEEIIQETFLRLYKHLHDGGSCENERGWVFRVAHNIGVDELRKRKYNTEIPEEFWDEIVRLRTDPSPGPEEILLRKERMRRISSVISMLSEQQRQCLFMRAEGLRHREIAESLGVTISTVAESLRRAMKKLTARFYE